MLPPALAFGAALVLFPTDGSPSRPDRGPWRAALSAPRYEVETADPVRIEMADGTRLVATVHRPKTRDKVPTILVRSAYGRATYVRSWGPSFAKRGYAYVAQDCRGRFDSEGDWYPLRDEARDGHDTLDWIVAQDWSNGDVGMMGTSYTGWTQWLVAGTGHPALKAIIPVVAPPDPHENLPYDGGTFFLPTATWAVQLEAKTGRHPRKSIDELMKALETLPLADLDEQLGVTHPFLDDWLAHPNAEDPFWDDATYQSRYDRMDLAVLHVTGWIDGSQPGALMNYPGMRRAAKTERARKNQRLIIGPWLHAAISRRYGPFDFGQDAELDFQPIFLRWFDRHLLGIESKQDDEDPVWVFVMGENRWHPERDWPLPQTEWTPLHLAGERAHRRDGGGRLTLAPEDGPPQVYVYDPEDPGTVPHPGLVPTSSDDILDELRAPDRDDVLDFTSPPLTQPVELTGPLTARLWVRTDAPSTDFAVTLLRLTLDGRAYYLGRGIQRLDDAPSDEATEITIDLWATGVRLETGERLRVTVQSALFPIYSRNLNTGEPLATGVESRPARQTVYHDTSRPSHVVLPVVPRKDAPGISFE